MNYILKIFRDSMRVLTLRVVLVVVLVSLYSTGWITFETLEKVIPMILA